MTALVRSHSASAVVLLHLVGAVAGYGATRLGVPLAWMIGPMLSSAAAALLFEAPQPPRATRLAGQLLVGAAIGLYLTPAALQRVVDSAFPILLCSLLITLVSCLIGIAEVRLRGVNRATAIFSCIPGGPVEMANLASQHGGDPVRTALSQTVRVMAIVLLFPLGLVLHGTRIPPRPLAVVDAPSPLLLGLLVLAVAAGALASRARVMNPYFIGPLVAVGAATSLGVQFPAIPAALVSMAQLLLGVSLGTMFRKELFGSGFGFVASTLTTTALLLVACVGLAAVVAALFDQHFLTMVLANAPGGVTEMALTAKATELDVSLVVAFHIVRIVMIVAAVPLIYRLLCRFAER